MRKNSRLSIYAALAAAGLSAYAGLRPSATPPRAAVSGPAPDFELSDIGGRAVTLSRYRGKVVLLNFWATWCESCQEEMGALEALYRRHRAKGFVLLAPAVDQDGRKAVLPFVAKFEPSFPILIANERTARAYDVFGLPTSFLIDAEGRVARKYVGPLDPRAAENDILEQLRRKRS